MNGGALPSGTIVEVFDTQGTLAGFGQVTDQGRYGLIAVYQDDPGTPSDEGAEEGDILSFSVNGQIAYVMGPDVPRWTSWGLLELDLYIVVSP